MIELKRWADGVEFREDLSPRDPGSKHQKQILLIQDLVTEARVNPSQEVYEKLAKIHHIPCPGNSDYVAYCRYLQYELTQLPNDLKSEGKNNE